MIALTLGLPLACADATAGRDEATACEQLQAHLEECFGPQDPLVQCDEATANNLLAQTCDELEQSGKDDGLFCGVAPSLPWCANPAGDPMPWPNEISNANSDLWISENHEVITQMRPRVLAINYVNARSMEDMRAQLTEMRDIIAESSRWHGYDDPSAPTFLEYELAYTVDLRDAMPPADWAYTNSTLYPREDPVEGRWGFDYEQLFTEEYAEHLGIEDPDAPGTNLALCDAIDKGLVHEVWIYGSSAVDTDVEAAEVLELKPKYNGSRRPALLGGWDRCAGNGCFDTEDDIPCDRSIRVAWFNEGRGPGCFLEGVSHAFEGMGRRDGSPLPYLERYFSEFSGMELDETYDLPFRNWYECHYGEECVNYVDETTVEYTVLDEETRDLRFEGTIENYDPVCGNVHWTPNSRLHYDLDGTDSVRTSCTHWRDGTDQTELYTGFEHRNYDAVAPDCMGPFLMWWRQNVPGYNNTAIDDDGEPMLNWWPFLFY